MFTNKIPYFNIPSNKKIKHTLTEKKISPWDNIMSSNVAENVPKNV